MAIRDEFKSPKPKTYAQDTKSNVKLVDYKTFKKKWIPSSKDSTGEIIGKIISIIAIIVLIACLGILAYYFLKSNEAKESYSDIQNEYQEHINNNTNNNNNINDPDDNSPRPILPGAQALLDKNPDTIGWIEVPGTKVKYPVVMRKNAANAAEGNGFYLNHMFDGSTNRAGAVFADYRTTIEDRKQSDNIVLYAHNEKDNSMFGDLDLYKKANNGYTTQADIEFYKKIPVFNFNTNYEFGQYKIFAMFITTTLPETDSSYPIFDYQNYIDFDRARYDDFISKINERNMIKTDIDVRFGDKFVTMSTCSNEITDSRFVIIGRKVRKGEDASVNINSVEANKNFIEPNWNAIFKNYRDTMTETTPADTTDSSENTDISVNTDNTDITYTEDSKIPVYTEEPITEITVPPVTSAEGTEPVMTEPTVTEPIVTEPVITEESTASETELSTGIIIQEDDEGPGSNEETHHSQATEPEITEPQVTTGIIIPEDEA